MPCLHLITDTPKIICYPLIGKYYHGMLVWVDGWGKVVLVERNLGVLEMQYYVCIEEGGKEVGWIRVPKWATLMRAKVEEGGIPDLG